MTTQTIGSEIKINNILFWLCFFITFLAILITLIQFFTRDEYPPTNISLFYIGVLTIYSLHKEAIRFLEHARPEKNHKPKNGEFFVYFWIIMTASLYLINFLTKNYFLYSAGGKETTGLSIATYITLEVGVVFVLARILKLLMIRFFILRHKGRGQK